MGKRFSLYILSFSIAFFIGWTGFSNSANSKTDVRGTEMKIANAGDSIMVNRVGKRPKNVIFMIGDGMGIGQMEVARLFEYGHNGRLFMETLPHVALAHTYSANNFVTDSAAAGTALATGVKTNNEAIGVSPDGKEIPSILDKFKEDGKKVGIISTNTVTDATPAAFTASVANRWSGQSEIARQQFQNGIDVILGGGRNNFEPANQDGVDLIGKFKEKGYTFVSTKEELMKAKGDKLLGLFHPSYMNFILDRDDFKSKEPTLPEMTEKAIEFLSKGNEENGFFVMIEGAKIDHAAHSADFTSIWKETIDFDHAVKYATNWAKENGNTLVVVVADHETMGISATEPMDIEGLKKIGVSPWFMASKLKKKDGTDEYIPDSIKSVFKKYIKIDLTEKELRQFNKNTENTRSQVYAANRAGWEIGSIIAERHHVGVENTYVRSLSSTGGHSGNLVPVFAYGDGAEAFEGILENTDIPKIISRLMGYDL